MDLGILAVATRFADQFGVTVGDLIPLVQLKDLKSDDLTIDHVKLIAKALKLNINATDDVVSKFITALKDHGIDAVADLIQSPEDVAALVSTLGMAPPDENLIICPHCSGFIVP